MPNEPRELDAALASFLARVVDSFLGEVTTEDDVRRLLLGLGILDEAAEEAVTAIAGKAAAIAELSAGIKQIADAGEPRLLRVGVRLEDDPCRRVEVVVGCKAEHRAADQRNIVEFCADVFWSRGVLDRHSRG